MWKEEILVDSPPLQIPQIDEKQDWERKRRKEGTDLKLKRECFGRVFITEMQRIVEFVHSWSLRFITVLLFLPAIIRLRKMIKRLLSIFSFSLPFCFGLPLRRNKRYSFSYFLTFVLTSTRIRAFSVYLYYFLFLHDNFQPLFFLFLALLAHSIV